MTPGAVAPPLPLAGLGHFAGPLVARPELELAGDEDEDPAVFELEPQAPTVTLTRDTKAIAQEVRFAARMSDDSPLLLVFSTALYDV